MLISLFLSCQIRVNFRLYMILLNIRIAVCADLLSAKKTRPLITPVYKPAEGY